MIASMPKSDEEEHRSARLTKSTCSAWLTKRTRPTLNRCGARERRPFAGVAFEPAGLERDAHEEERAAKQNEQPDRATYAKRPRLAKMCHISCPVNESSAKIASSGMAFASKPSEERSWLASREKTQRRIASRP